MKRSKTVRRSDDNTIFSRTIYLRKQQSFWYLITRFMRGIRCSRFSFTWTFFMFSFWMSQQFLCLCCICCWIFDKHAKWTSNFSARMNFSLFLLFVHVSSFLWPPLRLNLRDEESELSFEMEYQFSARFRNSKKNQPSPSDTRMKLSASKTSEREEKQLMKFFSFFGNLKHWNRFQSLNKIDYFGTWTLLKDD